VSGRQEEPIMRSVAWLAARSPGRQGSPPRSATGACTSWLRITASHRLTLSCGMICAGPLTCKCKTSCLTLADMAETITIRTDEETEHALDVLTGEGISRSAAIRQAVIHAAERRERAAQLRRAVLAMDIGEPDGIDVAAELARDRGDER